MTYECLLYEVKDGIATLTLNRPNRLNALGGTLRQDLFDAVTRELHKVLAQAFQLPDAGGSPYAHLAREQRFALPTLQDLSDAARRALDRPARGPDHR